MSKDFSSQTHSRAYGFISGVATTLGYFLHIDFLLIILSLGTVKSTPYFLWGILGARIFGEWLFWSHLLPRALRTEGIAFHWDANRRGDVVTNSSSLKALAQLALDAALDISLIYLVLLTSASPLQIALVYSISQVIGPPIHGLLAQLLERNTSNLLYLLVSLLLIAFALEILGIFPRTSYHQLLGLQHLEKSTALLVILGAKSLLTGLAPFSKAIISENFKHTIAKQGARA